MKKMLERKCVTYISFPVCRKIKNKIKANWIGHIMRQFRLIMCNQKITGGKIKRVIEAEEEEGRE